MGVFPQFSIQNRNRKKHMHLLQKELMIIEHFSMLEFYVFNFKLQIDGAQYPLRSIRTTVTKRARFNNFVYLIVDPVY